MANKTDFLSVSMPRDEAIQRFGSCWYVSDMGIQQELGPVGGGSHSARFVTLDEAIAYVRERHAVRLRYEAENARRILNNLSSRVLAFRARYGLLTNAEGVLKRIAHLKTQVSNGERPEKWEPQVHRLPEMLPFPYLLEIGTPLWLVNASWPLSRLEMTRLVVTGMDASYSSLANEDVKFWSPRYSAGQGNKSVSFLHERAHPTAERLPCHNVAEQWLFTNREGAVLKVEEICQKLESNMDRLRAQVAELDLAESAMTNET